VSEELREQYRVAFQHQLQNLESIRNNLERMEVDLGKSPAH
jgi:exonuclease VII small subunit